MMNRWTPMKWPAAWTKPSAVDLLEKTPINCLVFDDTDKFAPVIARARQKGLAICSEASLPPGVILVKGEWPGVKLTESGTVDRASAGPTGAPWVDSNGWRVRLAQALHPGKEIWVEADPRQPRLSGESYLIAVADAAAAGGRWITSLDGELAERVAQGKSNALGTWQKLTGAAAFFAAKSAWLEYRQEAVLGILSDFSGKNEFMSHELLNLVARSNQQYRVIAKVSASAAAFDGLKAVIYADEEPPPRDVHDLLVRFVTAGGMLITGPKWGEPPGELIPGQEHPRYVLRAFGGGRVAVAQPDFEDPYLTANDAAVLISHRYDLLRFWNTGAVGSYLAVMPDRKAAVVQMLFYAAAYFGNPTLRVSGLYHKARLWTFDRAEPVSLDAGGQGDGTEIHLPTVSQYAAVELEL